MQPLDGNAIAGALYETFGGDMTTRTRCAVTPSFTVQPIDSDDNNLITRESENPPMASIDQKVAVITGASQGIGAALVTAYRNRAWAVVANSRSITASEDHGVVTVA